MLSSQFADRLSRKVYFLGEHEHPVAMEGAKETLGDKDVLGISLGAWEMEGTKEILGLPLGDWDVDGELDTVGLEVLAYLAGDSVGERDATIAEQNAGW